MTNQQQSGALIASMQPMFRPASVAVIGASATPGKQGHAALNYLRRSGFAGRIYPVNPAGGVIEGLPCLRAIGEAPERVDCAFLVIPARATLAAIEQCAQAGVRAAVIGSSGFAELGTDAGRALQAELTRIARAAGMRILGPNTNGVFNATDRFSVGFNTSHGDQLMPGPVSIAAHSGALFNSIAPRLYRIGVGLSKFASAGNEADLDILDLVEFYIADDATKVIGLIVEAVGSGERLRDLAAQARAAGKPVVALKLGRSTAGAGATLAHSSRLAGGARAYAAYFAACGIVAVASIEALAGACALLVHKLDRTHDCGLVCVSSTGGGGALLADHAMDHGLKLAGERDGSWGANASKAIASFMGAGRILNPVDTGNLGERTRLDALLEAVEADGCDGPTLAYLHQLPQLSSDLLVLDCLQARRTRTGSPVIAVSPGGLRPQADAAFHALAVPVFDTLATCFQSLRALYDEAGFADAVVQEAGAQPADIVQTARRQIIEKLGRVAPGGFLPEHESAAVLKLAGLAVVETLIVDSMEAALQGAKRLGFPVVLKALAPGVAHKHDAGLVAVDLRDDFALQLAFDDLKNRAALFAGDERFDIILQPMLSSRAEFIVGSTYEPALGHFLVFGLGSLHAEALDATLLLPAFLQRDEIRMRIMRSRLGPLIARLEQGEGARATLLDDIVAALAALQSLLRFCGDRIAAIDVNPVLATVRGLVAVDALIVTRTENQNSGTLV